jgi:ribose/xylose/arabinose/galactoside ABC-type transport system permease subunit
VQAQSSEMKTFKFSKLLSKYGIYFTLALLVVVMTLLSKTFFTTSNLLNVLRQISITAIIALGMTFVIITGGIDLSVGSTLALCGVIATSTAHPGEYPLILSIGLAIVVGAFVGFVNGFIIAKTDIAPFIVTLGMTSIARGSALLYTNGRPVIDLSEQYTDIGQGLLLGIPIPIFIFLFLILVTLILLHKSKFGRYVYAIGGNEMAAKVSGINVSSVKMVVYTIVGALAGVSGLILSARTNSGAPNAALGYELDAIAACVIGGASLAGGRGTILGTFVGALIIGIVNNGLDLLNVSSYLQSVIKGIIIIVAVLIDKMSVSKK